jgi:YD repeat-containing protein
MAELFDCRSKVFGLHDFMMRLRFCDSSIEFGWTFRNPYKLSAKIAPQKLFNYDPTGNLLSKSDVGTYAYPLAGSALPHAVSAVNGTINSTFTYDPNGNQTGGLGRSITYTSFNMPVSITEGSNTVSFAYDADHRRVSRGTSVGRWLYFDAFGVHSEILISSTQTWYDYVSAGGAMAAMRVTSGATVTTLYFHTDHLGSIAVLTDVNGNVVEPDGYDAWGKRRFPSGADASRRTATGRGAWDHPSRRAQGRAPQDEGLKIHKLHHQRANASSAGCAWRPPKRRSRRPKLASASARSCAPKSGHIRSVKCSSA